MTAFELVSTMEAARSSWRLSSEVFLSKRQLLFLADVVRGQLLDQRRDRDPTGFENSSQPLPLLTPKKAVDTPFGPNVIAYRLGPIPRPLESKAGPGFTFVGVYGEERLDVISEAGVYYRTRGSRVNANRPCAMWLPASRELVLKQPQLLPLAAKCRIQSVFLHPIEAHLFTGDPNQPVRMVENPLDFEYPIAGNLIKPLLELCAQHEKLTTLLPPDLENDDDPTSPDKRR